MRLHEFIGTLTTILPIKVLNQKGELVGFILNNETPMGYENCEVLKSIKLSSMIVINIEVE